MTHKIRFADKRRDAGTGTPIVGFLKLVITLGVWALVALAGLLVWGRVTA